LLLFWVTLLSAHPHCFIDVHPAVDGKKLTVKWVFDQMSSQMLMMDFDRDADGRFSDKESRALYKEGFESLKAYDYYTEFFNGSVKLPTGAAEGFRASVEGFRGGRRRVPRLR
ncbi:MAG: DUF1007 family protein, partial [Campylobacterales bacterium]